MPGHKLSSTSICGLVGVTSATGGGWLSRQEFTIIIQKTQKGTKLLHISGNWGLQKSFHLVCCGVQTLSVHSGTQVVHRWFHEAAFGLAQLDPMLLQPLQDLSQIAQMGLVWWWLCGGACMWWLYVMVECGGGSCILYNYVVVVVVTM